MLELAAAAGIGCDVGDLSLAQLYAADEVFVTGTMGGLTPVTSIDGRVIGAGQPGPVTRRLQRPVRRPDRPLRHAGDLAAARRGLAASGAGAGTGADWTP